MCCKIDIMQAQGYLNAYKCTLDLQYSFHDAMIEDHGHTYMSLCVQLAL